jgi:hypothetical protein
MKIDFASIIRRFFIVGLLLMFLLIGFIKNMVG